MAEKLREIGQTVIVDLSGDTGTGIESPMKNCRGIGCDREGDVKLEITIPGQTPYIDVRYIPAGGFVQQSNITRIWLNYALNTPTTAQVYKVTSGYGALVTGVRLGV
jgi:hypothetical protein